MYLTVKQCVEKYPFIPMGGIRHMIFKNVDFRDRVVKKVGKKILLDEQAFLEFIKESKK